MSTPLSFLNVRGFYEVQNLSFSTVIRFDWPTTIYADRVVNGPLSFGVTTVGAISGYQSIITLVADGQNVPTFSGAFKNISGTYNNNAGTVNYFFCTLIGADVLYSVHQPNSLSVVGGAQPPILQSISSTGGSLITLTYSKLLDTGSVPAIGAFTLSAGVIENVAVVGAQVRLTTAANTEPVLTVSYATPVNNRIRSADGAAAASFTAQTVSFPDPEGEIETILDGLNKSFTTPGATLEGWTTSSTAITTVSNDGARVEATADGWSNNLLSPAFRLKNGDNITISFTGTDAFGVIGLTPINKNLASFSAADSLLLFSNNGGSLHNGQSEIGPNKGYTFAPHGNELRLAFLDGAVTAEVWSEDPGVFGIMVFRSSTRIAIPRGLYGTVQVMVAPFSAGSAIQLRSVTTTSTISLPAGVLVQRPLAAKRVGYNLDPLIALANDNWGDSAIVAAFAAAANAAGAGVIRLGGDGMNFYDWARGGMQDQVASRLPNNPDHFHTYNQQLPIWLAFQDFRTSGTLANVKNFIDAIPNATVVWCANVNTAPPVGSSMTGPQYEVAQMQAAVTLGLEVDYIELGNELYFDLTYYGKNSTTIGFQTAAQYAAEMLSDWIPAFKAAFPGIKIAVPAFEAEGKFDSRETDWNFELIEQGTVTGATGAGAHAFAVHPYVNGAELGIALSDIGSASRASAIAREAYTRIQNKMRSPSIGILPAGGEIWITESGLIELRETAPGIIVAQTWFHGLLMVLTHMVLLKDRRCTFFCIHVLTGNAQWDAVTNELGTGISPSDRGTQNVFDEGRHPAFVQTIMGFALGIAEREVLGLGGTAQLLADDPTAPYMAWRLFGASHDRILIINLGNTAQAFTPPSGQDWEFQRWTNPPWQQIILVSELPAAVTGTIPDGANVNVPAHSMIVLISSDEPA